ncbi:ribosomal protein S18-alanine N-acetyltransferase [Ruminococcus sp.]|uniref:ribosomal protein S18-alanine N-acetyltransferase n=1 Tax=Ruminococcus sp. TaxID=41978 RepID=UPI002630469C|nr:ribosomal protein S18-alanine N-acetyltransferase [Ruminococcus sp.]MDD6989405.1 ribosomal protein S18-alanine N-acetyltransferase [Ruminococcus sp.]MDY6202834.1 ribosomal protein S18-alanine N-acetyltransferase [Ruminococcus sp.]
MRIEKMTLSHLDDVYIIETECFSHPWSRQSLEDELNNETSLFLVAKEENEVIGYIGMSIVIDEGYIFNVAVREKYRKKGVATALINELITYGKKNNFCFLTLEVRESNRPAISLYSKFGFLKAGERKDYYSNPKENAILMTKYF